MTGTENGDFGVFIPTLIANGGRSILCTNKTLNGSGEVCFHERAGVARRHRVVDVPTRSAKEARQL